MTVTIKDVAKRAGVATSTVSRTLKNQTNISEATKAKVRKAIKELGYVPNMAAQNLASKATNNIGLILPPTAKDKNIEQPFFMDLISEISQALNDNQYTASIASANTSDKLLDVVKMMQQKRSVDGFMLLYSIENDLVAKYLLEEKVHFVMIGKPNDNNNQIRYVDNDNISVGRTATKFLIDNGHRNIIFVGRNLKEFVFRERFNGYKLEMDWNNLSASEMICTEDALSVEKMISLLNDKKIDAIVAGDDVVAVKLMPLLSSYGYEVGQDISLIGVNNSVFSTLFHPYLTTINIHVSELAKQGANLVVELLSDQTTTNYVIPHEIVVRETVKKQVNN